MGLFQGCNEGSEKAVPPGAETAKVDNGPIESESAGKSESAGTANAKSKPETLTTTGTMNEPIRWTVRKMTSDNPNPTSHKLELTVNSFTIEKGVATVAYEAKGLDYSIANLYCASMHKSMYERQGQGFWLEAPSGTRIPVIGRQTADAMVRNGELARRRCKFRLPKGETEDGSYGFLYVQAADVNAPSDEEGILLPQLRITMTPTPKERIAECNSACAKARRCRSDVRYSFTARERRRHRDLYRSDMRECEQLRSEDCIACESEGLGK